MAIYRPPRRRWTVGVTTGLIGLLLGLLIGWGLLRPEPDPAEVVGTIRSGLVSAAGTLEVVGIEYAESVEDGKVVAEPEYEGARSALASSRERYLEARPGVTAISPDTASSIDRAYDDLERSIERRAPEEEVTELTESLAAMLTQALGG
jgi:hypothetical protein